MREQLKRILEKDKQFNSGDMALEAFGFRREAHYDVLVVAPGWKPTKILRDTPYKVTQTAEHSYFGGYEVQMGERLIAWAQTGSGGCNLIDHLTLCADLNFDKLVFVGAVGGLKPDFDVGDVCTPVECIQGTMANAYLQDNISAWKPFGSIFPPDMAFVDRAIALSEEPVKKAKVFCTDSISCEYYHLPFIHSFDPDLIEMETSSFYLLADLMEKPAIALLAVSDNSANGEPLMGKSQEQEQCYDRGRKMRIPELIRRIAEMG